MSARLTVATLFLSSLGTMSSSVSHFDHSFANAHLIPLLATILSRVWNNISNTTRPRPPYVDPDQATESVERDSDQMVHYIVHIVTLTQSWWEPLYDDTVLYRSQKIFNIIMGYNHDGYFFNDKAVGLAGFADWCRQIDRIRSRTANHDEARRELQEEVDGRMQVDPKRSYESQRKQFTANFLHSNLGDRHMAEYLITKGAPWLLQAKNLKTKRALERTTADKTKIYHLGVNFLKWWGRAMHFLSNYSNSLEVRRARIASSVTMSEREKRNSKQAKDLHRALKSGSLQYHELTDSQEKLLLEFLALRFAQECLARNPMLDAILQMPWPDSPFMSRTSALTAARSCAEAVTPVEGQTGFPMLCSMECGEGEICHQQDMPTLCPPPGLNIQASTVSALPEALLPSLPQVPSTKPES